MASGRSRIRRDGTLPSRHVGGKSHRLSELYHGLATTTWVKFFGLLAAAYFAIALLFAIAYYLDLENFKGIDANGGIINFWKLFLFSAQTLSTVGGIAITPDGLVGDLLFTLEAMVSLLFMTLMTGLLYARFSTQTLPLVYSENAVVAPYKEGKAFMLRLANERRRPEAFIDFEAELIFNSYEDVNSNKRSVETMCLTMKKAVIVPSTWTIVHEINTDSPFSKFDLDKIDYEILVKIKSTDSVTGQTVYSGQAYAKKNVLWNARFLPCSEVNEDGVIVTYIDKIGDYELIDPKN